MKQRKRGVGRRGRLEELEARRLLSAAPILDINQDTNASSPTELTSFAGAIYFAGSVTQTGDVSGLFRLDPVTKQITQIASVPCSKLMVAGSKLYFQGIDSAGRELWASDGTAAGTASVIDINPGPNDSVATPLASVGGKLLFRATAPASGYELWISDGTSAGTSLLKDILPGFNDSYPDDASPLGSSVLFAAYDGSHSGLWKTDGTSAGTVLVKYINNGLLSYSGIKVMNGFAYFAADDGTNGAELWRSDGTGAGTSMVKDVVPGSTGSYPLLLGVTNGHLLFSVYNASDGYRRLWTTDGTGAGTIAITPTVYPADSATVLGGYLYFGASSVSSSSTADLWRSDGTSAGTTLVSAVGAQVTWYITSLVTAGSHIYFDNFESGLWGSDGTSAGTEFLAPAAGFGANWTFGSDVYFTYDDLPTTPGIWHGTELWTLTGTGPASMVADLNATTRPSYPGRTLTLNGIQYFVANDGAHGNELWRSDGTTPGTFLVKDIAPGRLDGILGEHLGVYNGKLYFAASSVGIDLGQGIAGNLWTSDGTAAGTALVSADVSAPDGFTPFGGSLYFEVGSGDVWKTDGTTTTQVGHDSTAYTASLVIPFFSPVGDKLFFGVRDYVDGSGYHSNSTAAGIYVHEVRAFAGKLYFGAVDYSNSSAEAFYAYDPITDQTQVVATGLRVSRIEIVNGSMWLVGNHTPWISDGTPGGTHPLAASNPTIDFDVNWESYGPGPDQLFHPLNGAVYFEASDPVNGQQLWKSDGTSGGTAAVTAFNTPDLYGRFLFNGDSLYGLSDSVPELRVFGGKLYFFLNESDGVHLYQSDGTLAGTTVLPGVSGVVTLNYGAGFLVGDSAPQLFFALETDALGIEPYVLAPPSASAGGDYQTSGGDITLSAAASQSNFGAPLTYSWDLDNDGIFGETGAAAGRGDEVGASPLFHAGSAATTLNVAVRVTDSFGLTATDTSTVSIASLPGLSLGSGASYTLSGAGSAQPVLSLSGSGTFTADIGASVPGVSLALPAGASAVFNTSQHVADLAVSGGQVSLAAGSGSALVVQSVSVTGGGQVNLRDNVMLVDYSTGASPLGTWNGSSYSGVLGLLASGRAGGAWTGPGIASSSTQPNDYTTLGVAEASEALGLVGSQTALWNGQTIDANTVLIKYTYGGDADLNGHIDGLDYGKIDSSINLPHQPLGFYNGDFNFDGVVNGLDYGMIDGTINTQGSPLPNAAMAAPRAQAVGGDSGKLDGAGGAQVFSAIQVNPQPLPFVHSDLKISDIIDELGDGVLN